MHLRGAVTLGQMYKASSSLGVKLNAGHRLMTHGPFAIVRHPLYPGLNIATLGGDNPFSILEVCFCRSELPGLDLPRAPGGTGPGSGIRKFIGV